MCPDPAIHVRPTTTEPGIHLLLNTPCFSACVATTYKLHCHASPDAVLLLVRCYHCRAACQELWAGALMCDLENCCCDCPLLPLLLLGTFLLLLTESGALELQPLFTACACWVHICDAGCCTCMCPDPAINARPTTRRPGITSYSTPLASVPSLHCNHIQVALARLAS
jgi:hypothetical protein